MTMNALEKLTKQAPDLVFELPDNTPVVRLGLIATVYFKEGYLLENKKKVMECFDRFKKEFRQHLKWQFDGRYKKLTDDSFKKTTLKILETDSNEQYEWHISSAPTANEAAEYSLSALNSFEVHGDQKRSYLKITLPWAFLQEADGAARYQNWLVYLSNQVRAEHGYGGLSSILPYDFDSYMPMEFQLAQRFSGLEVDSMVHNFKRELLDHIKGVNWYTVLGKQFVERIGGEDRLRHAFGGRGDSMTIRTLIPRSSGHRFHGHPDTFRQAATQDYSLPSTSFFEAKRSSWSVYPCVKSERYYA